MTVTVSGRRAAALVAALSLLAPAVAVLGAAPATAAVAVHEVYPVPASRVFTVEGHGFGHGYGMSQYGAEEAGRLGVSAASILSFYYPGATSGLAGRPSIRVALTGTGNGTTTVGYRPPSSTPYQCTDASVSYAYCTLDVDVTPGLTVTDAATGATPDSTTGVSRWRVAVASDGLHLSALRGGVWAAQTVGGRLAVAGPLRFGGPTFVKVDYGSTARDYRGSVSAAWTSAAGVRPARMIRLDTLGLDDYVRGVVYRESPGSWPLASLEAQAVAARTYADASMAGNRAAGNPYDICDSTYCQVFGGSRVYYLGGGSTWLEPSPTADPVALTADQVLLSGGRPVWAEFGSSNGGWTAGSATSSTPRYDTWDDHSDDPNHDWTATLSAAGLESAYGFARLDQLVVTARDGTSADWGGRVRGVELDGVDWSGRPRTVTLTSQYSLYFGMRSTFWHITSPTSAPPPVTTTTILGPGSAARGSVMTLTGTAPAGQPVTVHVRWEGATTFGALPPVTATSAGTYTVALTVTRDVSWYADAGGHTSKTGTTAVTGTTATAPAAVPVGSGVYITGYAAPGSAVPVFVQPTGGSWARLGTFVASATGSYRAHLYATSGFAYYATSAGLRSPIGSTAVVPTVAGPPVAARGGTVTVTGRAAPYASVAVYLLAQNTSHYVLHAVVRAGATGTFTTAYRAEVDDHYYAVAAGQRSAHGLTRASGTTATGPATAVLGSRVTLTGLAAPGSAVTVYLRRAGSVVWRPISATFADAAGYWARPYTAGFTYAWYAVSQGLASPAGLTVLR